MSYHARYFSTLAGNRVRCELCPHLCLIAPGKSGRCRVRINDSGQLLTTTWGEATAHAVDPIEKKPLYHVRPGSRILSIGGWSCNLTCDFCQNWHISQQQTLTQPFPPEQIVRWLDAHPDVTGVSFTYNEPLIAIEYIEDTARLLQGSGKLVALVSNGFIQPGPLEELLPWIDAWNIDLKGFREDFYKVRCGASLAPVLKTIEAVHNSRKHLEVTHLMIPDGNDSPGEFAELVDFLADVAPNIPLHISRYHPDYKCDAPPTPPEALLEARETAKTRLQFVYLGNVREPGTSDTFCPGCDARLVERSGYQVVNLLKGDTCHHCGTRLSGIF